jgi:hypothetical protein
MIFIVQLLTVCIEGKSELKNNTRFWAVFSCCLSYIHTHASNINISRCSLLYWHWWMTILYTCKMKQHNLNEYYTYWVYFSLFVLVRGSETKRWDRLIIRSRSNCVLRSFHIREYAYGLARSFFSPSSSYPCRSRRVLSDTAGPFNRKSHLLSTRPVSFCLFELRLNNCRCSLLLYSSVCAHTDFVIRKCTRVTISQVENNDQSL